MNTLTTEYRNLEQRTLCCLREAIGNSNYKSKHTQTNAIKVDMKWCSELAIINDSVTLIDKFGHHYSVFNVSLELLIETLEGKSR